MSDIRIDARQNEYKPLVQMLDSGEYDSSQKLASAIIKQAYLTFLARDWYSVVWRNHGLNHVWGLYATYNAAQQAIEDNELGLLGEVAVFPIKSRTERTDYVKTH